MYLYVPLFNDRKSFRCIFNRLFRLWRPWQTESVFILVVNWLLISLLRICCLAAASVETGKWNVVFNWSPRVLYSSHFSDITLRVFEYLVLSMWVDKASDTPGDFIRRSRRIWSPAKIASDFRHRLMRKYLAIFFADRSDVAVLKTHVIKSPNLMGWLYWRFAAINVENRGNGHTWRMPANLIANIWHARYRRYYTPIAAIGENRNRCTGHTWRFSPIAAIGV